MPHPYATLFLGHPLQFIIFVMWLWLVMINSKTTICHFHDVTLACDDKLKNYNLQFLGCDFGFWWLTQKLQFTVSWCDFVLWWQTLKLQFTIFVIRLLVTNSRTFVLICSSRSLFPRSIEHLKKYKCQSCILKNMLILKHVLDHLEQKTYFFIFIFILVPTPRPQVKGDRELRIKIPRPRA